MQNESLGSEVKALEDKLAAYTEAFARAQRTLLDASEMLRALRRGSIIGLDDRPVAAMIDACSLAAMHPGVVEYSKRRSGLTFDTGGSSFDESLGEAIEAARGGREWVYIGHGGARMQVQATDTIEGATSRWMKDVYGKPGIARNHADGMPWSVGAGRLSVELHALTDLLALARSLGAEVGTFTVHELARIAGDLHASSYVVHSIALNKIHALLNNMPEPSGPMPAGSAASIASTVERVQILVDVLRKATDALAVGGAA